MTNRQAIIESLENSLIDHEGSIERINERLAPLYEAERQANIKLFMEHIGFTINHGDVLNVTEEFKDYAKRYLTEKSRSEHLELWNQRKEGTLTIYDYDFRDGIPTIYIKWTEVEYLEVPGPYFQDGIARVPLHNIYFYDTPIAIIKAMYQEHAVIKEIEDNPE